MNTFVVIMICLINIPILYLLINKYFGSFTDLNYYIKKIRYNPEIKARVIGFIGIIFLIVFFEVLITVRLLPT
ncbi:hypothetical protein SH1V18_36540 [Vallitalea longa]|uniref:Uncharacterized protein n=1 Tax=Vallitalea longa TaxID=2936439 RepID=A0A9W6DHT1_9FIRM|nr:hypothetical protein [Vallitalea longa]GKX31174.1 hypothetical protein SH1V18_36540 [Vallitalea longa]